MQQEFYRLLTEVKADGVTVFLSSRVLPEVERVCDRVGIIRAGRLDEVEEIAALKSRALRRLEIRFASPVPADRFEALASIQDVRSEGETVYCTISGSLDAHVKFAAEHEVVNINSNEPSLEEIFLAYYDDGGGAGAVIA